jgi:23S rRNA pseudouridine1911/1915/1917 synthase
MSGSPTHDGRADQGTPIAGGRDGVRELRVDAAHAGHRLDEFLAARLAIGRRAAVRLAARARVDGRRSRKGDRLRDGQVVCVPADDAGVPHADADLTVVRVLPDVLVIDKPVGLPSVGLRGAGGDSVAARVAARDPGCAHVGRDGECGLVHRLDTGTSGVLLAARSDDAYRALRAQFRAHAVEKEYLALVAGVVRGPARIDTPIGQHHATRRRMRAVPDPERARRYATRDASTDVVPERVVGRATLVRARTSTGARHQIRVHLASIGHPLLGDPLYGGEHADALPAFLLHACRIAWREPGSGVAAVDEVAPPAEWEALLAQVAARR